MPVKFARRMFCLAIGSLAVAVVIPAGNSATQSMTTTMQELQKATYAPVVRVVDTVSSLGPLNREPQAITLEDLVKYHGHPCDGLVIAAAGISHGLRSLFPQGTVDRTDVVAACNASCCYGDVAAFYTGARARYGTLVIDKSLGDEWILHRRTAGKTLRVVLRPGIKPPGLVELEARFRGMGCDPEMTLRVRHLQDQAARAVLAVPPEKAFDTAPLASFPYPIAPVRADAVKAACAGTGEARP